MTRTRVLGFWVVCALFLAGCTDPSGTGGDVSDNMGYGTNTAKAQATGDAPRANITNRSQELQRN